MTHRLIIDETAKCEWVEAAGWYRDIEYNLARRFNAAVRNAVKRLLERPLGYAVIEGGIRKIDVQVFPYQIFYEVAGNRILVLAILHSSRYPRFGHH